MQYGRMAVVASLLVACSAPIESTTEATTTGPTEDGSTSSPSTTSEPSGVTSTSTSTSTSTPASNSTSTSSLLDSSSGSTGAEGAASEDDGGCGFLCDPDGGSRFLECDIWDQDCPRGEKCTPWVSDGGSSWNAMRCVPVAADPDEPGEPCTKKGEFDSCALGSICWDIDAKTGEGTCVSHCVGSEAAPVCADPTRVCDLDLEGFLHLCVAWCDPVDPDACPAGTDGCFAIDDGFVCFPDGSSKGAELFDACELINSCNAGLRCADPDDGGVLCEPDAPGCCLPYCDLDDPSCPAMTACTPFFEDGAAYPEFEHVGVCTAEAE